MRIRKLSFPFRFQYRKFYEIYQDLDNSPFGSAKFADLVTQNVDFTAACKNLLKTCGVPFSEKDVLYGKTRIFLNERFKIAIEKALVIRQKAKRAALQTLCALYKSWHGRFFVSSFIKSQARAIRISKEILGAGTPRQRL